MAQLLSTALQYLYNLVARHTAILTIESADGTTSNFVATNISVDAGYGYYSVTMTFDLTDAPPVFSIKQLMYYTYDANNALLYSFDISITGFSASRGVYIFTVTVYVSDTLVSWQLS